MLLTDTRSRARLSASWQHVPVCFPAPTARERRLAREDSVYVAEGEERIIVACPILEVRVSEKGCCCACFPFHCMR